MLFFGVLVSECRKPTLVVFEINILYQKRARTGSKRRFIAEILVFRKVVLLKSLFPKMSLSCFYGAFCNKDDKPSRLVPKNLPSARLLRTQLAARRTLLIAENFFVFFSRVFNQYKSSTIAVLATNDHCCNESKA